MSSIPTPPNDLVCVLPELTFRLDARCMRPAPDFFARMAPRLEAAFDAVAALEAGAIANPDEGRQVGHYWLRAPELAPDAETRRDIEQVIVQVKDLAWKVHNGVIAPPGGGRFRRVLLVGIGGSALGPMFVDAALRRPGDPMRLHCSDNTDPDGIERLLGEIGAEGLAETLVLVISKSGGTPETRNGMVEVKAAFAAAGLDFAGHAMAVTGVGSKLDAVAAGQGWLARVPMSDYVGGRTSVLSGVGLLPAALQGFDVDGLLTGAATMDRATRVRDAARNPAALMALLWHHATNGRGEKDMVILPYKDRLELFSRYLQQLVMESLGKEKDLDGRVVHQGIAVYGNKGSTDQHAYVQQLREGVNNFFAVFLQVLRARSGAAVPVDEKGFTSGDYLNGFLLGTRQALFENGRESMTITVEEVSARTIGMLIALFERAVSLYAVLVNINAYHQPGVEAGKKAAAAVLELQERLLGAMKGAPGQQLTAAQWAEKVGAPGQEDAVHAILEHLAWNVEGVKGDGGLERERAVFGWG